MLQKSTMLTILAVVLAVSVGYCAFALWHSINALSEPTDGLIFWLVSSLISFIGLIVVLSAKKMHHLNVSWKKLKHNVNIDPLTGLPNQQKLLKDLENTSHPNLAFLKITDFNSILNTYGPAITDDLIRQIASRLANYEHDQLKKSSAYYVQPGIFAIVEDQNTSIEQIASITGDILKTLMSVKYQVGFGEYVAINITVGAVRQKQDAYILANMALQEALNKKQQFYLIDQNTSQLPERYKQELKETQMLLQAIRERRVTAYFQPIIATKSMTVDKYECLARLIDDEGEVILMPGKFMPLAHRANVYYLLSQIMIKKAVEFALTNNVIVAVNISITDINNKNTCEYIFKKIKKTGVGHLLHFELLENEVIVDTQMITGFILALQSLGCQVGMDDLGKGYSNIERLFKLPIDFVKIDRTIMENISHNSELRHLAAGMVTLAKRKKLEVVAEYCSDAEVVDIAIKLGVDYLQGFYFGKPQPNVIKEHNFAQAMEG